MFKRSFPKKFTLGPAQLSIGDIILRYVRSGDGPIWSYLRIKNEQYLRPWEPVLSQWDEYHSQKNWARLYVSLKRKFYQGTIIPLVIELNGSYIGQVTVGNIVGGALSSGWLGYWVDEDHSGLGVATAACSLVLEYIFGEYDLHRLEATVRQENFASVKVLHKLGFQQEGLLHRYMHIDGQWNDHLLFAITEEAYSLHQGNFRNPQP